MREIKFRGKRIDNGEWVFGSFVPDALETPDNELITWGFIRRYNREIGKMETIEVDRESVCQYTGLKDKNGVEIYEGDIVCAFNGKYIGEVFYQPPEFVIQNFKELRLNFFEYMPNGELNFGVLGNRYDNPELLE